MEGDSWSRISAKRHQASLLSRFDLYLGFEEAEGGGGEEEMRTDFPCPFCSEDFDVVGLCCHIDDEHPAEAKIGICPVCAARVGSDMVGHITMEHGGFYKMPSRRRFRKSSSGSHSSLSLLRKEMREGNIRSLLGGTTASSNVVPDPLLSSFILNFTESDPSKDVLAEPFDERSFSSKTETMEAAESVEPCISQKDQQERAGRSEFARHLVLSTLFDGIL